HTLLKLRKQYAYGDQDDYFTSSNCIGFVRHGDQQHPNKLAVLISNAGKGSLRMFVGNDLQGKQFYDALGYCKEFVEIDEEGFGNFKVEERSVSAWIIKDE
ncbi:MAG: DUF1939 domain-containing protein, partial [Erysipelotrichaceae bacterium]|nr:DUF1939 domain-containing protein [Erysipelotrichaceae bacterium]